MSASYTVRMPPTAVTTARTLLQVRAGATPLVILDARVDQVTKTASELLNVQLLRKTVPATVTPVNPLDLQTADGASGVTLGANATGYNASADGTDGDVLDDLSWNALGGSWSLQAVDDLITVPPGGTIALELQTNPAASMTLAAQIKYLEVSGDFSPTMLSPRFWLRADTLVLNDGDPIAAVYDAAGNGYDATQATSAQRPTKQTVNGEPVMRFDGTDDNLQQANAAFAWGEAVTMFWVASSTDTDFSLYGAFTGAGLSGVTYAYGPTLAATGRFNYNKTGVSNQQTDGLTFDANLRVYTFQDTGSRVLFYQNGVSIPDTGDVYLNTAYSAVNLAIGSRNHTSASPLDMFFAGDIGEILCFAGSLSVAERMLVERYLALKYGLYPAAMSPDSIANMALWLKPDAFAGGSDGALVTNWTDSSGNGRTAQQLTGAKRATLRLNPAGFGGKPALQFDGGDAYQTTAFDLGVFTIFAVFNESGTPGMTYQFSDVTGEPYLYGTTSHSIETFRGATGSAKNLSANWAVDGKTRVTAHRFDGTHAGHVLFVNGILATLTNGVDTGNPGTGTVNDVLTIGARNVTPSLPITGYIAEIIVYTAVLTDAEVQGVATSLMQKYGLLPRPFNPEHLGNMGIWLKGESLALNDGDPVSEWPDSSGRGGDWAQGTGASKPTFVKDAVNGKPAVHFDGTDDFIGGGDAMAAASAGTMFLVVKLDVDPIASPHSGGWVFGSDLTGTHFPYFGDQIIYDDFGTTARKTTRNPLPSLGEWRIYSVISAANDWRNYIDGALLYSTGSNTVGWESATEFGRDAVGGGQFILGSLAELLVYRFALTEAQHREVVAHLIAKYGLTPPPFDPKSVTGLVRWYKADAITGLNDGDPIAAAPDSTGNANLSQATGSKRPTYRLLGKNGLPVMRFDGVDDVLEFTPASTTVATIFLVGKTSTGTDDYIVGGSLVGNGSPAIITGYGGVGLESYYNSASGPNRATLVASNAPTWHIVGYTLNDAGGAGSFKGWADGAIMHSNVIGDLLAGNNFTRLGAAYADSTAATGTDIAEVLIYNAAVSEADAARILQYLNAKWRVY